MTDEYVCDGCGRGYPSSAAVARCQEQHDREDRQEAHRGR